MQSTCAILGRTVVATIMVAILGSSVLLGERHIRRGMRTSQRCSGPAALGFMACHCQCCCLAFRNIQIVVGPAAWLCQK